MDKVCKGNFSNNYECSTKKEPENVKQIDNLDNENVVVKYSFQRMESSLESFESTISLLDRIDKSSVKNII